MRQLTHTLAARDARRHAARSAAPCAPRRPPPARRRVASHTTQRCPRASPPRDVRAMRPIRHPISAMRLSPWSMIRAPALTAHAPVFRSLARFTPPVSPPRAITLPPRSWTVRQCARNGAHRLDSHRHRGQFRADTPHARSGQGSAMEEPTQDHPAHPAAGRAGVRRRRAAPARLRPGRLPRPPAALRLPLAAGGPTTSSAGWSTDGLSARLGQTW